MRWKSTNLLFVLILAAPILSALEVAEADDFLTEAQAKEEIEIAVSFLKRHHPDPFWHTSQDEFEFAVRRSNAFEGERDIAEHYFKLAELYASVLDTHTQLYPTTGRPVAPRTYPIRFRLFSEGLFVFAAGDPYRSLVGKRIVSVGGQSVEAVVNKLTAFASSENFYRKRAFSEIFFYWPEMYRVLGLSEDDGSVSVVVENVDGVRENMRLNETRATGFAEMHHERFTSLWTDPAPEGWTTLYDVFEFDRPLYRSNMDLNYWYTYIPENKAMYVQINRRDNQEGRQTALEFNLEWFKALRETDAERFILDLRNDPGGWINITDPIPGLLSGYRRDNETLQDYIVLIGADSVSAASIAAAQMEYALANTVTIGQPTGSGPNLFLNSENMELPYSKFALEVSTTMMPRRVMDDRMFIAPDIWIDYSFKDYIEGRDPTLDAALHLTQEERKAFHADHPAMHGWRRNSQDIAFPRTRR